MLFKSNQNKNKQKQGRKIPSLLFIFGKESNPLFLFIAGTDFVEFVSEKLQLRSDRAIADAKTVGSSLPFIFAKLGFHKAAFTICSQHFVNFIDNRNFFHFVTS